MELISKQLQKLRQYQILYNLSKEKQHEKYTKKENKENLTGWGLGGLMVADSNSTHTAALFIQNYFQ